MSAHDDLRFGGSGPAAIRERMQDALIASRRRQLEWLEAATRKPEVHGLVPLTAPEMFWFVLNQQASAQRPGVGATDGRRGSRQLVGAVEAGGMPGTGGRSSRGRDPLDP